MVNIRVIPCLLLEDSGLVKTVRFKDSIYIGDPINTLKLYNDKEVDEIIFLDISASKNGAKPRFDIIENIASECFMPLGYGGGVRDVGDVEKILSLGVEKVSVNLYNLENSDFITEAAKLCGSQSIVAAIDVKKDILGRYRVYNHKDGKATKIDPVEHARQMEDKGAGEILVNSVDRDGMMKGYDIGLIKKIADAVSVPVIACGGAGSIEDLALAVKEGGASAVAAGSLFVFQGEFKGVLVNYPSQDELKKVFK